MRFTAQEMALLLYAELHGADDVVIDHVASLVESARGSLAAYLNPKWRSAAQRTTASVVITGAAGVRDLPADCTVLICADARAAWGKALRHLLGPPQPLELPPGVHPSAYVDEKASLGSGVRVGPLASISGDATIGADCLIGAGARIEAGVRIGAKTTIMPNAVVLTGSILGAEVWLGAGAVVGSIGFGLDASGRLPHAGIVRIGDRVSIGANCCIDRATVDETVIQSDSHLDNLVQVGHNARIGTGVVICGQAGIAGSTMIGDAVVIGGQAGLAGHLNIANGVHIAAQSGVTRDLKEAGEYSGHPAEPNRERLKRHAKLKRLVET